VLFIATEEGRNVVDEPKIGATLTVADARDLSNKITDVKQATGPEFRIGIELRGRSSQLFPKKGFGIELRDASGSNLDAPLLGMPAADDWALHGPFADRSLLRNALAYTTARAIGAAAPRTRFCEVVLNGAYIGIYLLCEKADRGQARIPLKRNIDEPPLADYLVQINFELETPTDGWVSTHPFRESPIDYHAYHYEYPKARNITSSEAAYLQGWFENVESILTGPDSLKYAQFIDLRSWIDYIIMNELGRDVDAYNASTFLVKRADGLIYAGPIWDQNFAFGNSDYCGGRSVEGLSIESEEVCKWRVPSLLFGRTWADPAFRQTVAERYFELRQGPLGDGLFERLDSLEALLSPAVGRNFARWPIEGTYHWPNAYVGNSWPDDVNYLRGWLVRRINYLDKRFGAYSTSIPGGPELQWSVGPNPVLSGVSFVITTIRVDARQLDATLIDYQGKVLATANWLSPREGTIDTQFLPAGNYIVAVRDGTDGPLLAAKPVYIY